MTFRLVSEVFNSIYVVSLFCKWGGVVNSPMMKVAYAQCIVSLKAVCVNHTVGLNILFEDRQKRFCFSIGDDGRVELYIQF